MNVFIVARTANGRPSLQHKLSDTDVDRTECGLEIFRWSRAYTRQMVKEIICKKCLSKVVN